MTTATTTTITTTTATAITAAAAVAERNDQLGTLLIERRRNGWAKGGKLGHGVVQRGVLVARLCQRCNFSGTIRGMVG